jgi:predicted O-linked N-acetylglucosamine transferase (SPINDLY family)
MFGEAIQHHRAGRLAEAEALYRQVLVLDSGHAGSLNFLGVLAHQRGDHGGAATLIGQAIALNKRVAAFHSNLGMALKAQGMTAQAVVAYRRALSLAPRDAVAQFNLGNALSEQGKPAEATAAYRRALAAKPDYADAHLALGGALQAQGDLAGAAKGFGQATALLPGNGEAHFRLGLVLQLKGDLTGAEASYGRVLSITPDHGGALTNLGKILADRGRSTEAADLYRRAIAIEPGNADAMSNLGTVLTEQGNLAEADRCYEAALALRPDHALTHSNLLMNLHYGVAHSGDYRFARARQFGERFGGRNTGEPFANDRRTDRRLRVGYVSGDFRAHPVGYFLLAVLPAHDRAAIELFCYSNADVRDAVTDRLRAAAKGWRDIARLSDEDAARLIRRDRIDLLVDLSGHTAGNRLTLFTLEPAPVQLSWLGYFGTTGLKAIDHVIADEIVAPPADDCHFTENVVRLPGCFLCYEPHPLDIAVAPPPALTSGRLTFGCLNNLAKITEGTIALWARLLLCVPGARLLLKTKGLADAEVRDTVQARFGAHGIAVDRLMLEGHSPLAEAMETYNRIDIALDAFPFGGGTTTADALWMGTPVVTLRGDRWVGRMSTSIMTAIGHTELIADDADEYLEIAAGLAADLQRLAALKSSLRSDLERSAFCDGPGFARKLEAAYRATWRAWCEGV